VFVALGIQHAMRMSRIVFSVACLALPCFSTSSHKQHFCVKTLLNTKCLFWFSVSDFSFKEELREMWSKIYGGCHAKYRIFLLTYLLTHSTVQSPSWEANWFPASQEISHISRNPKVHYRTHKRPPPVSILGQPNPVHIPTSQLLEIHPNIIHPSTPRSPQWSPSLRFPQQI